MSSSDLPHKAPFSVNGRRPLPPSSSTFFHSLILTEHPNTEEKKKTAIALSLFILLSISSLQVRSDGSDHCYKISDTVPLYANKVGPFHNPSETYRYFDLPFCIPTHLRGYNHHRGYNHYHAAACC